MIINSQSVSDFKFAHVILKRICRKNGFTFIDISLDLGEDSHKEGCLYIGKSDNVFQTNYLIIYNYVENSEFILGSKLFLDFQKEKDFLLSCAAMLRGIMYKGNEVFNENDQDTSLQYIYQRPLIWIIMKDIICPFYSIPFKDIHIISGNNSYVDIARFFPQESSNINDKSDISGSYPFVFVNQINNLVVQNAFLLVEMIKAYGLGPIDVLKEIFESEVYDKFYGILQMAFNNNENDIEEFISVMVNILDINLKAFLPNKKANLFSIMKKKGQSAASPEKALQWWYLGVIEGLLEPVRGSDWSTHNELQPYVKEFWNKVEQIKKDKKSKGNYDGVSFEELLRLKVPQTVEYKGDPNKTLQSLLSSQRIW